MSPTPSPERIVGALRLMPMTVHEIAACLSMQPMTVRRYVRSMRDDGALQATSITKTRNGRPWIRYALKEGK